MNRPVSKRRLYRQRHWISRATKRRRARHEERWWKVGLFMPKLSMPFPTFDLLGLPVERTLHLTRAHFLFEPAARAKPAKGGCFAHVGAFHD